MGFFGMPAHATLGHRFKEHGISLSLVQKAANAHEPAIDELCLLLMEKLIERDAIPKSGPGTAVRRPRAISDTTINYLISMMLGTFIRVWGGIVAGIVSQRDGKIRLPTSLVLLIRQQLCGNRPDLYREYLVGDNKATAAIVAAEIFPKGKISVRELQRTLGISRMTAARWLADKEFLQMIDSVRAWDSSPTESWDITKADLSKLSHQNSFAGQGD